MTYQRIERQTRIGPSWDKQRAPDMRASNKARARYSRNLMVELHSADTREMEEFWEAVDPRLAELFLLYTIPLILAVTLPTKF